MRARAPLFAVIAAMVLALAGTPARADDDKQMAQHKITQAKSYVPIEPMYATILDDGRPVGLLLVHIGLSVSDEGLRIQTEHALPVLRDAYLRNLMIFAAAAVRPWQQPDVIVIANRLQRVTDRALHSKGAKVLLGQVMIRISR
jgi:flagellar basal body-associated protein FliL